MEALCNIFEKEKKRVGDKFDLYYNKKDSAMRYSNKDGALTVKIDFEKGTEDFYYRSADEKGNGIGTLVRQHANHGKNGTFIEERLFKCPQDFINLCTDYQFNRKAIGIDERPTQEQKKNKKRDARGFER